MSVDTSHTFTHAHYRATVRAHGAELCSFQAEGYGELIWAGIDPWTRHSPVLFPIVGRLRSDIAEIDGTTYRITQHGFARDMDFTWIEKTSNGCALRLTDSAETRQAFPFAFSLTLRYRLDDHGLHVAYELSNPADVTVLSASLGTHPAFVWPIPDAGNKTDHSIVFEEDEPSPIRNVRNGLLTDENLTSPVTGNQLALSDQLFEHDALIFLQPESSALSYQGKNGRKLDFRWTGFTSLGLWMKPGADFLCIEPWQGYASPENFIGDFTNKPGLIHLKPGEIWNGGWSILPADIDNAH